LHILDHAFLSNDITALGGARPTSKVVIYHYKPSFVTATKEDITNLRQLIKRNAPVFTTSVNKRLLGRPHTSNCMNSLHKP